MRAAHRPAHHDAVLVGDLVVDDKHQVRKRPAQGNDMVFHALDAADGIDIGRVVMPAGGGEYLGDDVKIATIGGFSKTAAEESDMIGCGHE